MNDLVLRDLVKSLGGKKVLQGISLSVRPGEVVGFVGPNGAGKSTTMKTMVGLLKADAGEISVGSWTLRKDRAEVLARVCAMIDSPPFYPSLSALDHVLYVARLRQVEAPREASVAALEIVGLSDSSRKHASAFSTGMKQRLALAMALVQRPSFLILDEPTNGLDPLAVADFRRIVGSLAAEGNIGVLISSHMLSEIERICERVIFIRSGCIVKESSMAQWREGTVRLRLRSTDDRAAEAALAELPSSEVTVEDGTLFVSTQRDQVPEIAKLLVRAEVGILELAECGLNLEEEYAREYSGGTEALS